MYFLLNQEGRGGGGVVMWMSCNSKCSRNKAKRKKTTHQCKEKKLCISERKSRKNKYPAAQEKQTIHQCRKNKLSSSARKTNYPPVHEKQIIQQRKKNTLSTSAGKASYPPVQKNKLFCTKRILNCQSIIAYMLIIKEPGIPRLCSPSRDPPACWSAGRWSGGLAAVRHHSEPEVQLYISILSSSCSASLGTWSTIVHKYSFQQLFCITRNLKYNCIISILPHTDTYRYIAANSQKIDL